MLAHICQKQKQFWTLQLLLHNSLNIIATSHIFCLIFTSLNTQRSIIYKHIVKHIISLSFGENYLHTESFFSPFILSHPFHTKFPFSPPVEQVGTLPSKNAPTTLLFCSVFTLDSLTSFCAHLISLPFISNFRTRQNWILFTAASLSMQ